MTRVGMGAKTSSSFNFFSSARKQAKFMDRPVGVD